MLTMCLHPRYEITQQESIQDFDQCDYVYSLNDVDMDNLVVLQLNIRGLYTKLTNLSHLLSNCIVNRKPDVVLLSEMWLTPISRQFVYLDMTLFTDVDRKRREVVLVFWYQRTLDIMNVEISPRV